MSEQGSYRDYENAYERALKNYEASQGRDSDAAKLKDLLNSAREMTEYGTDLRREYEYTFGQYDNMPLAVAVGVPYFKTRQIYGCLLTAAYFICTGNNQKAKKFAAKAYILLRVVLGE